MNTILSLAFLFSSVVYLIAVFFLLVTIDSKISIVVTT